MNVLPCVNLYFLLLKCNIYRIILSVVAKENQQKKAVLQDIIRKDRVVWKAKLTQERQINIKTGELSSI